MVNTINMQDIQHLNLFSEVTRINTRFCMEYNRTIIFCVPKEFVNRAVGEEGRNIRRLSEIMNKKARVIAVPRGIQDARGFIQTIVKPVMFKDLEIKDNEIILTAGSMQNKASLIGRDKKRFLELQKICKDFFGKELKIV
jgi:transcription antitermination factor NusA-like protein